MIKLDNVNACCAVGVFIIIGPSMRQLSRVVVALCSIELSSN